MDRWTYNVYQTYKRRLSERKKRVHTITNVIPLDDEVSYKHVTYQQIRKSCGRSNCATCHGRLPIHGPYWQRTEWDETSKKQRTTYIGKKLPPHAAEALAAKRYLTNPTFRKLVRNLEPTLDEWRAKVETYRREIKRLRDEVRRLNARNFDRLFSGRDTDALTDPHVTDAAKIYRQLALKYHLDRNPATADVMQDLNRLWHAVTKQAKRAT